jgi:hypothetical protein
VGRCSVVLRRVLIRRVVATTDVTAFQTQPEMDPRVTGGETFLATVRRVRAVLPRLTEVSAQSLGHALSLRYVVGCWKRRTGDRRRYKKASAAMTAAAKRVGRSPTRSPMIPAPNAAGGATANPMNRVAELTRPRS